MCDPYGLLKASTTTQVEKIDAGPRKVRVRLAEAKSLTLQTFTNAGKDVLNTVADVVSPLNPLGGGGSSSGSATDESRGRRLPPLEVVLMSSGCTMLHRQQKDGSKYDTRAQYSSGWLCATQNRGPSTSLTRTATTATTTNGPAQDGKGHVRLLRRPGLGQGSQSKRTLSSSRMPTRRATLGATAAAVWLRQARAAEALDLLSGEGELARSGRLPLPFEEIEGSRCPGPPCATRCGSTPSAAPGSRSWTCATRARPSRSCRCSSVPADVRHTLFVMRLLAERTAQTANSAKLIAASWADRAARRCAIARSWRTGRGRSSSRPPARLTWRQPLPPADAHWRDDADDAAKVPHRPGGASSRAGRWKDGATRREVDRASGAAPGRMAACTRGPTWPRCAMRSRAAPSASSRS